MSDMLTAKQAHAVWTLLATGGQGRMPVKSVLPEALLRHGLIRKGYRAGSKTAWAEVTDRGWAWAEAHLSDETLVPKALQPWFGLLKTYLDTRELPLAALVVNPPEPLSEAPVPKPKAAPKPKALTAPELRKRIEAAYLQVTEGCKNESVRLNDLRAALPDIARTTLDKGLARILKGDKKARLSQAGGAVPKAEQDAAFTSLANEPFHYLWIHA